MDEPPLRFPRASLALWILIATAALGAFVFSMERAIRLILTGQNLEGILMGILAAASVRMILWLMQPRIDEDS